MKYTSVQLVQKNGRWRGQLQYKDEEGKWKKKTKMLSATGKREAQKELEAWHLSMEEAALTLSGQNPKETVADYVSRYIEGRSSYVERSSLYGYRQLLKNQIAPGIGDIPLDDLEPDMVQDWVNDLCERYTAVVVRKAFTLLKSAMTQAVERDRLLKNPTRTVKPPKLSAPKPNAVNAEGRAALMAVLDLPDLAPAMLGIKIALYTGMREGEICGLRWKNIDLETNRLMVCDAIGSESGSRYYVKEPKTGGSRRVIAYPDDLARALRRRLTEVKKNCLAVGVSFSDSFFVLGGEDGLFMPPHYLSRKWKSLADAMELVGTQGKRPTFHDLRHTYATAAISNGVDVKTVSSQLGHANAAMTLNTYASPDPEAKRQAADAIGKAFAEDAKRGRGENVVSLDAMARGMEEREAV